jgi:four helix bundle protein
MIHAAIVRWLLSPTPQRMFCMEGPLIGAARAVVDELDRLLGHAPRRLLYSSQLRESAQSITANIREGMGRRKGPEREQFWRFARASAEETDEHLRANFAAKRIPPRSYWRLHHRLMLVVKILRNMPQA